MTTVTGTAAFISVWWYMSLEVVTASHWWLSRSGVHVTAVIHAPAMAKEAEIIFIIFLLEMAVKSNF